MHFFNLGRAKIHVQMAFGNALWPNGATRLASNAVTDLCSEPSLPAAYQRCAMQLQLIFEARFLLFI